ncbi:MAG: hypothetical protein QG656_51 [Candidatus Hydrogenedentes bacterium]|nr:hypothetical protein [Candidatus Hydrogenedentota bacterium]
MMQYWLVIAVFAAAEAVTAAPPVITNDDDLKRVYEQGANLISPYMELLDRQPALTAEDKAKVREGIVCMKAVTDYVPANWAAFWIAGKGYQALGEYEAANKAFKDAFDVQKQNPDVAREYAVSCLELGKGAEAVRVTLHAIELSPEDAGLYANLALAYLIDGKNEEASRAIAESLKRTPEDAISQTVKKTVDEVIAGKRPQPKKLKDLMEE